MKAADDELARFFQEVVLVLGGVFALHPTSDATVRQLALGLERAYRRAKRRGAHGPKSETRPHIALNRLLRMIRANHSRSDS